ncbi:unnamed protein product [Tetraodon nigroviridis]|uniref:(spotted green pufferfish) hypothetical protein n=1 Tax=Tetraodon nigroviridis TaxID=99883 RepID=Q4RXD9_TETNG|nr:unnamed protein product [Tetraodon nigroviridis]
MSAFDNLEVTSSMKLPPPSSHPQQRPANKIEKGPRRRRTWEKLQRDEEDRKKKLQLYVFVMRCVAYPFNAKQPTDMARRQQKVRTGPR